MNQIFDSLPGMQMPVGKVIHELAHMWDGLSETGLHATDSRASQLNLVLHLGLGTAEDEANGLFETCLSFARTYPCRIIVLCPTDKKSDGFMGKLFSQCYIGENLREACCCEALILGYSIDNSGFLENQVSVWLEPDLPVYHWFHRVPADRISRYYREYLKRCRRIIYDGEVDGRELDHIDWPHPQRVRDLAYSRTLPLRQHLGQFLSGFSPAELASGLREIRIQYHRGLWRTANQLMHWQRQAIRKCFAQQPGPFSDIVFTVEQLVRENSNNCLQVTWKYADSGKFLRWNYGASRNAGLVTANLTDREIGHPLHIEPLPRAKALSEALFFG